MPRYSTLLIPLFEGFSWFDEGLQTLLREAGWTAVTRPQTMVLIAIGQGIERPADIARHIGVTRQSAGVTIAEMAEQGLLELSDDPTDRRAKRVQLSEKGQRRSNDSRLAMATLTEELERRIGKTHVRRLDEALQRDWGPPITR